MILYQSHLDIPAELWRWKHFRPVEFACKCGRHCRGQILFDPVFFEKLETLRERVGRPLNVNSGTRCALHNAAVGGAPLSMHKPMDMPGRGAASDLGVAGWSALARGHLLREAYRIGFGGYGYASTFLHVDNRALKASGKATHWDYSEGGMKKWTSLIS